MVLKLTVCDRNLIFFFYKPKHSEILIFGSFLAKFSILAYVLLQSAIWGFAMFMTSLWRHTLDVCS